VLENLTSDVRFAFRWLRRSPGFSAIAILSLAIGVGFNTALFTIVDSILFKPLPVERPGEIVDVYTTSPDGDTYATTSYPDYLDLKAQNHVFGDVVGYSPIIVALSAGDRSRMAIGEVVTGNFFLTLGIPAHIGRLLTPDDDRAAAPRAVVLSYGLWARDYGASPSALGGTIKIHGNSYTIVGVADRAYSGMVPLLSAAMWIPMAFVDDGEPGGMISVVPSPTGRTRLERRGTRWMFLKGRLKSGVTAAQAQADLQVLAAQLATTYPATNRERKVAVVRGVHLHPEADRMLLPIAMGLMLVVGLVLIVACANVASMLLARASGRQKEIAIRLAIGASRRRLIAQLLTESAILAIGGATAGLAFAWVLTQIAMAIRLPVPIPIAFYLHLDLRVLAFTTAVAFAAALVSGLAPALKATRPSLTGELKGDSSAASVGSRRWTLRDGLVAAQIAVTTVLLVTAGLLTRSLIAAQQMGVGFEPRRIAIVSTDVGLIGYDDPRAERLYAQALDRIRALPGVEAAGLAERTPLSINYNRTNIFIDGRHQPDDLKGFVTDATRVAPEYFPALGVSIVQGRNFGAADLPRSPRVAIVNEAFAKRYWPSESAVGKTFRSRAQDGPQYQIVGVCADYKVDSVGEKPTPYVHYAYSQNPSTGEAFVVRARGDASLLLAGIRREVLALEPNTVFFDMQTMTAQVDATLMPARLGAASISVVGVVAMILAAVGLYGVIAYSVARRTREIGIRMALGAKQGAVVALVMKQGLGLTAVGVAIGALLAAGAAKAASGALYQIGFLDPLTWSGAIAVLFATAALANVIPARRAAIVDPSSALRSE
jgi:predicted permease